ncbi:hypothetical protein [Streptomyces sp. SID3343]|uniref:hypothetical protein n=1 Tax=Streptomyces sp. SID3343 TaxID=2690260 RepID=UPI001927CF14|nr:hypothetical protein [Streptomyces sp. SID3343]
MSRVRPTLRCLREDLTLLPSSVDEPLDEINHPLLTKVKQQFTASETPRERIASVDDRVLFKAKIQHLAWRRVGRRNRH